MIASVPVRQHPNNSHEVELESSNSLVAEARPISETVVVELDPGKVAPHDQIPLNLPQGNVLPPIVGSPGVEDEIQPSLGPSETLALLANEGEGWDGNDVISIPSEAVPQPAAGLLPLQLLVVLIYDKLTGKLLKKCAHKDPRAWDIEINAEHEGHNVVLTTETQQEQPKRYTISRADTGEIVHEAERIDWVDGFRQTWIEEQSKTGESPVELLITDRLNGVDPEPQWRLYNAQGYCCGVANSYDSLVRWAHDWAKDEPAERLPFSARDPEGKQIELRGRTWDGKAQPTELFAVVDLDTNRVLWRLRSEAEAKNLIETYTGIKGNSQNVYMISERVEDMLDDDFEIVARAAAGDDEEDEEDEEEESDTDAAAELGEETTEEDESEEEEEEEEERSDYEPTPEECGPRLPPLKVDIFDEKNKYHRTVEIDDPRNSFIREYNSYGGKHRAAIPVFEQSQQAGLVAEEDKPFFNNA